MSRTLEQICCPRCGKDDVYRIHRTWLLRKLSLVWPVRRYTCYSCLRNFYVHERTVPRQLHKHTPTSA